MLSNLKTIHELSETLNKIKGFEALYTTKNRRSMLIKHNEEVYEVHFSKVGEGDIEDYMDELNIVIK